MNIFNSQVRRDFQIDGIVAIRISVHGKNTHLAILPSLDSDLETSHKFPEVLGLRVEELGTPH